MVLASPVSFRRHSESNCNTQRARAQVDRGLERGRRMAGGALAGARIAIGEKLLRSVQV